jgi:hypothetical protein
MVPDTCKTRGQALQQRLGCSGSIYLTHISDAELRGYQVQATDIYAEAGYECRLFDATKNNFDGKKPKQVFFPHWGVWIDPNSIEPGKFDADEHCYLCRSELAAIHHWQQESG